MLQYYENKYAKYKLDQHILYITYKKGISIDLKASTQIVKDRLKLHKGVSLPILCNIRGVKNVSKPARNYLAMEGSTLIEAVAFIIESPLSEIISQFYIQTNNPPIPSECFVEIPKALDFLNEFVKPT